MRSQPSVGCARAVQRYGLIADVYLCAVEVLPRPGQQVRRAVIGIGRVRRRAAQLAVAHARQAARAVVGEVYRAKRVLLRRRNRDAGDQAIRVVGKLRHTVHRIGDLVQTAFRLMAEDVGVGGSVAAGVLRRFQPRQTRLQDLKRHHIVRLVCNRDLYRRRIDPQLQLHALGVLEGAASAGIFEEVLGAVAVFPDVVVCVVQRQGRDLLVRVGLPAAAPLRKFPVRQLASRNLLSDSGGLSSRNS